MQIGGYRLLREVGRGGHGRVYKATDDDGNAYAIKQVEGLEDPKIRARFERERRALAELRHLNLARLVDAGQLDADRGYLVMEFIDGCSLRALIRAGQPLLPELVVLLARSMLDGLIALHEAGVIHRDLKLDNMMLTATGRVVIVDLGLAHRHEHSRVTSEGAAVGSVPYMAPEQLEGGPLTPATDLWALGVCLYELLVGERPFARELASEEVGAILAGVVPPLAERQPRVSASLAKSIVACLERDPSRRPTAAELAQTFAQSIDWIEPSQAATQLFALADPDSRDELEAQIVKRRVALIVAEVRESLGRGDLDGALGTIERGLAYAPEELELAELLDEATANSLISGGVETADEQAVRTAEPSRSGASWRWALGAGALAVIAGAVGFVVARNAEPPATVQADAAPEPTVEAVEPQPEPEPQPTEPTTEPTELLLPAYPKLPAIPAARLSNDEPSEAVDLIRPGDPLFPPSQFTAGSPEQAIAEYDAALAKTPDDVPTMVGRALALLAQGKTAAGLAELARLRETFPDDALVWDTSGAMLARAGDSVTAEQMFTKALALEPGDTRVLANRGIIRRKLGRFKDAYGDLVTVLRDDPDNLDALKELAQLYSRVGYRHDAVVLVERVVELDRTNPDLWFDLASARTDPASSLAAVERGLALAPHSARGKRAQCDALVELRRDEALSVCERAVELSPDSGWAQFNLGLAREMGGDLDGARAALERAVALDPDDDEYRVALARVSD